MTEPTPAAQQARDTQLVGALLDAWEEETGGLPEHREAWQWLLERTREEEERRRAEPNGGRIPPWERPKRARDKAKRPIVGRFIPTKPAAPDGASETIERYEEYDPECADGGYWSCDFTHEGTQGSGCAGRTDAGSAAGAWAVRCAAWRRRGRPVVLLQDASGSGFNLFLLHLAPALTQMGYRVRVVAARNGVCALSLQRGHHSWPFWSIERCTGIPDWQRHVNAERPRYAARALGRAADRARGYQTLPGSETTLDPAAVARAYGRRGNARSRSARPGTGGVVGRAADGRAGTRGDDGVGSGRAGRGTAGRVGVPTAPHRSELPIVSAWLSEVQDLLLARYGVSLRATIASAALSAAARRLPEGWRFWRPPALLDTLCRAGGGYRGGWVYARRYRASVSRPLIAVDVRRLYSWCLTQPLPLAAGLALGEDLESGEAREGLWLCTVTNETDDEGLTRAALPVALAVWTGSGFQKQLWRGKPGAQCVAVLSSGEIPGLRALGYGVLPGVGYWYTQTFDLRSYVASFQQVIDQYGASSWQSGITKQLGNCLSGKWGASQQVLDVCYSETVPRSTEAENARGEYWYPMLDQEGWEVPGCWERRKRWVCPSQQPHLAAAVTAHGRGKTYAAAAQLRAAGGEVYYVDTDGILTTSDPHAAGLEMDGATQIGGWRSGEWDADAEVAGPRQYQAAGEVVFAGSNAPVEQRRAAIALLVQGRAAELEVRVVRRPWLGGTEDRERTFRAPDF